MFNKLLFVLLFIISLMVLDELFKKQKAIKFKKRNSQFFISKDYHFQKILKKFNFLKSKDEFLSKQGYPLHLNAITYYSIKLFLAIFFFISTKLNYGSLLVSLLFFLLGFYVMDGYILLHKRIRDSEICTDLLNISNSISLQLSSNILLKDSLKKQFEICKNRDFKQAMLKFSTKYELSELDLDEALKELNLQFDIREIEMFCNSLKEYSTMSNTIEVLENLSETLKEKHLQKIRDATRNKILYITFGVLIALGNMIMLVFYPLFVSLGNSFSSIFN